MSKKDKILRPVAGVDYEQLASGAIRIARFKTPPTELGDEKKLKAPDYLGLVDHALAIDDKKVYEKLIAQEEERFGLNFRKLKGEKRSLIVLLQGRDGAGKSGFAKIIQEATDFDAKNLLWVPIGPPTDDELQHGHLWRFYAFDRMPRYGQVRIFDRSWAERGLVEPVMNIINEKTLVDSYAELRAHEWLLERQGAIVVKFWMDITKDEQKKRFKDRQDEKPWKYGESDKVAREHWDDYTKHANLLFHNTGTPFCPWFILSSEDKRYSRVTSMSILNEAIEDALAGRS